MHLATLPLASIRRPLQRQLDEAKVAAHERLGMDTIRARVRRATADTLRMHLR
jgi:uncharacterized ParB-like nuclease family protein